MNKKWEPPWNKTNYFYIFLSKEDQGGIVSWVSFASFIIVHICWDPCPDYTTFNTHLALRKFLGFSMSFELKSLKFRRCLKSYILRVCVHAFSACSLNTRHKSFLKMQIRLEFFFFFSFDSADNLLCLLALYEFLIKLIGVWENNGFGVGGIRLPSWGHGFWNVSFFLGWISWVNWVLKIFWLEVDLLVSWFKMQDQRVNNLCGVKPN